VIAVEIRELGRGVKVNKPGSLPLQLPVKSVNRWVEIGLDGFTHFLEEIAIGIEQYFRQYFDGLYFYVFALHYMDKMNEFEIQVCFPEISPSIGKLFQVNNLIDLWLAFDLYSCDVNPGRGFMTPNNVLLSPHNRLTVVTGSNNSGKTVYLRAIGIAQVFAQAGLPIPADYGKISPVDRIYTHFATGETGISRFEEEVAFVSNILDSYTDQSIVLLNETFQTTGVQEARMILENVLEALGIVGARTILVTHVSGLTASLIKNPEIGNICNALTMEVVDGKPTYRVIDNKKSYI
jgi:hypothetical protein